MSVPLQNVSAHSEKYERESEDEPSQNSGCLPVAMIHRGLSSPVLYLSGFAICFPLLSAALPTDSWSTLGVLLSSLHIAGHRTTTRCRRQLVIDVVKSSLLTAVVVELLHISFEHRHLAGKKWGNGIKILVYFRAQSRYARPGALHGNL